MTARQGFGEQRGWKNALPRSKSKLSLVYEGSKRKPWAACPVLLPFTPTFDAQLSPATKVVQRGETRATKWHQVQINLSCPKCTGGVQPQLVMGFPTHHRFPPKRNPKPRCTPP